MDYMSVSVGNRRGAVRLQMFKSMLRYLLLIISKADIQIQISTEMSFDGL